MFFVDAFPTQRPCVAGGRGALSLQFSNQFQEFFVWPWAVACSGEICLQDELKES
jgi:hypothetical protein